MIGFFQQPNEATSSTVIKVSDSTSLILSQDDKLSASGAQPHSDRQTDNAGEAAATPKASQ